MPEAKWEKVGGSELKIDGERVEIQSKAEGSSTLKIRDVNKDDAGEYSCTLNSTLGTAFSSSNLTVEDVIKPTLIYKPIDVNVLYEGENFELYAQFYGEPMPVAKWEKVGDANWMPDGDRIEISEIEYFSEIISLLSIYNVTKPDEGEYRCTLTNEFDDKVTFSSNLALREVVLPKFVKELEPITVKETMAAEFIVKFSGKPTPIAKWEKVGDSKWKIDNTRISQTNKKYSSTLMIHNVTVADNGEYQCTLTNTVGDKATTIGQLTVKPILCDDGNPCENGGECYLNAAGNGYLCNCTEHYVGKDCERIKACEDKACSNRGKCELDDDKERICKCKVGFNGTDCENDISMCERNKPCKNGGMCENKINGYKCKCPEPYNDGETCSELKWCKEIGNSLCAGKCELDTELNRTFCKCENEEYFDYESKTCKEADLCPLMQCDEKRMKCENNECVCKPLFDKINGTCVRKFCPVYCPDADCQENDDDPEAITCSCKKEEYFDTKDKKCKPTTCIPSFSKCQQKCSGNDVCSCHDGFKLKDDNSTCEIDADKATNCALNCGVGKCVNVSKEAICACPLGYEGGQNCTDLCTSGKFNTGVCPTNKCEIEGKEFKCICDGKYKYDTNGKTCIKRIPCIKGDKSLDVCKEQNAICDVKESEPEGYTCLCPDGYEKYKGKCTEKCQLGKYKSTCSEKHMECYLKKDFSTDCKCPSLLKYSEDRKSCSILEKSVFKAVLPIKKDNYVSSSQINYLKLEFDIRNAIESAFPEKNLAMDVLKCPEDGDVLKCSLALGVENKLQISLLATKSVCVQAENNSDFCVIRPNLVLKTSQYKFTPKEVTYCDEDMELCGSHSICNSYDGGEFKCTCKSGFLEDEIVKVEGFSNSSIIKCIDNVECSPEKCHETAECVKRPGDYFCKCKTGYRLKDLEKDPLSNKEACTELCDPNPCNKGTCIKRGDYTFNCECSPGFSGSLCNKEDDSIQKANAKAKIVGAVLGTILGIVLIIFFVTVRKLKKKKVRNIEDSEMHVMQERTPHIGDAGSSRNIGGDRIQNERQFSRNDRNQKSSERDDEYPSLPEYNETRNVGDKRDYIDDNVEEGKGSRNGQRNRGYEKD